MRVEEIVNRFNELILQGNEVERTGDVKFVDHGLFRGFRTGSLSFLANIFTENHTYHREFSSHVHSPRITDTKNGIEILRAAKNEIEKGWYFKFKKNISADIFSDFLEMSKHLLDEGYKDAAAVMIGGTLEQHLRDLCIDNGVEIKTIKPNGDEVFKKADTMNTDLARANVFKLLDFKNVVSWLELRNNAAHGKFDAYNQQQVVTMYMGVSELIARVAV